MPDHRRQRFGGCTSDGATRLFSVLTTNQKGHVAETAVIHECAKLGIRVAKPLDDQRYDLIFDLGERLLRVQCKWASRRGDVIVIPLYSARRTANGLLRTFYSPQEIDAFAVWCPETDRCYFRRDRGDLGETSALPSARTDEEQPVDRRSLGPRLRIRGYTDSTAGAVAQLGERRDGIAEARGSSPLGSISEPPRERGFFRSRQETASKS
jgi:PD-(D/E)XK endonuclease